MKESNKTEEWNSLSTKIKTRFLFLLIFIADFCFSQNTFTSPEGVTSTITLWKDSAIGAIWNKTSATVAYGKKDSKGYYKIFLSDSAGNNERPLTFSGWRSDRHQWAEEWYPNGEYLFCYVEKADYAPEKGHKRAAVDGTPGYGAYTDLWLVTRDGKKAWQLTNLPNNYKSGLIHGAISEDGTLFAWTERIGAPKITNMNLAAGSYVFRVADFVLDSVPHFTNIRTFQPGNVPASCELESFSRDKSTLSFYSTFETKNLFTTPIYTLNLITGKTARLTTESFAQAPTYTPDGKRLVYMTGAGCAIFPLQVQGADWWIMNTDGSDKKRISYMNVKNNPQSVNHYRLAGCISFMSNTSFLGGVMTKPLGLTGHTVKVTFSEQKK
jgi:Tol biopolymer transport system component